MCVCVCRNTLCRKAHIRLRSLWVEKLARATEWFSRLLSLFQLPVKINLPWVLMLQHPVMHPQLPGTLGEPYWGSWLSSSPVLLCVFVFLLTLAWHHCQLCPTFCCFPPVEPRGPAPRSRWSSFRYQEAVGSTSHRAGPADAPVIRASFHPVAPTVRPDPLTAGRRAAWPPSPPSVWMGGRPSSPKVADLWCCTH